MEGLYFEVKPRRSQTPSTSNKPSCPLSPLTSPLKCPENLNSAMTMVAKWKENVVVEKKEEVEPAKYKLTLVGSLPVHHLTTMTMLPWVVAEISKSQSAQKKLGALSPSGCPRRGLLDHSTCNQTDFLHVSESWVQCVSVLGEGVIWDPLTHTVLFECYPHQVTKIIHNSREPSSFGFLVREARSCCCYVFNCPDSTKVPDIIRVLRLAGRTSAREDEIPVASSKVSSRENISSQECLSSLSAPTNTGKPSVAVPPTDCAKKFEVLFCGRVTVSHKKPSPALIDECIKKFSRLHGSEVVDRGRKSGGLVGGLRHVFTMPSNGLMNTDFSSTGKHPVLFRRDASLPCLQALGEKGLSSESSLTNTADTHSHPDGVQPTSLQENRAMLLMVGSSQIFLVSPDTKKVVIEKSFREICYCSQGIHQVDHFGLICRETVNGGGCHFVSYIFQCIDESMVAQIMLTLKPVLAALQQNATFQREQCDGCPMLRLHRLCENIEGLQPLETKLFFQKHIATLDKEEQALIFENTMRAYPRSHQEENESVMASLRNFYEEKQRSHQHTVSAGNKQLHGICHQGSTISQPPTSSSGQCPPVHRPTPTPQSPTKATPAKLERHYSVSTNTPLQSKQVPTVSTLPPVPPCPSFPSPLLPHHSSSPSTGALLNKRRPLGGLRARLRSSSSVPSFLKFQFLPPVEENDSPEPISSHVAALSTQSAAYAVEESHLTCHSLSWRQKIFLRVATPQKNPETNDQGSPSPEEGHVSVGGSWNSSVGVVPEEKRLKWSKQDSRELWRKAILQQILLLRMEKENQKLQATEENLQNKRLKLNYDEITPCLKDVTLVWEKMLRTPGRAKFKFETEPIHAAVAQGVPKQFRGEIWKFLSEQYLLRQTVPPQHTTNNTPYKELLKLLTTQQQAILADLDRTFPNHPFFQGQMGPGQLSLYNILKAYSLLDPEVGYCQGLCFIAGMLLLHMEEEDAFNMLTFLMFVMGLRKQYMPEMITLQIQNYQLQRLLHDYHRALYAHLEEKEIGPNIYATPWFLTSFASHFPLGFGARVFDMLFLQGSEAIFKVALSLLGSHKPLILQHDSMESTLDFIKTTLPRLSLVQMEKTINQVCEMDLSKQLMAYEVEYHVLQDELEVPQDLNEHQRAAQLERSNESLWQQNHDLQEVLQVSQARVCSLQGQVDTLAQSDHRLNEHFFALEEEKQQLENTIRQLQDLLPTPLFQRTNILALMVALVENSEGFQSGGELIVLLSAMPPAE